MNKFLKKNIILFSLIIFFLGGVFFIVSAENNVDSTYHWAWNDNIGWIDFSYDSVNIPIVGEFEGYASSQIGIISFNCDISGNPDGLNYCSISNYKVSHDGEGNISGWAWNDNIGWISFNCEDLGVCATSNYKVTITDKGEMHGWAWNDNIGWISFNCQDAGICSNSDYKVSADWVYPAHGNLTSLIYDTQRQDGATLTGIVWHGTIPTGASVQFELGSSDSTTTSSFHWTGPYSSTAWKSDWWQIAIPLSDLQWHNNHRYIRYKIYMVPDPSSKNTPIIYDVHLKWAR